MTEKQTWKELFDEIINKEGPYKRDPLEHAENIMENASKKASQIKRELIEALRDILREGENGEASDCASSARYLLKDLGEPIEEY